VATRKEDVSVAIIKAKIRGRAKPVYLMQYDEYAGRYQMIGGRKRPDENALATMRREISTELPFNKLKYGGNYKLQELIPHIQLTEISPTWGAYTEYHFTVYQAFFDATQLKLGASDEWISFAEAKQGFAKKNGNSISTGILDFDEYLKKTNQVGLDGLPLSLNEKQKRRIKEIIGEHKVAIMLCVAGILVTILVFLIQKFAS
jgi:hypothetical protein